MTDLGRLIVWMGYPIPQDQSPVWHPETRQARYRFQAGHRRRLLRPRLRDSHPLLHERPP